MGKVILLPQKEMISTINYEAYNTVEAEYGNDVIRGCGGGVTLAHHGPRENNPAPCITEVEPNDLPILISHIDLDTIGGIMGIWGLRDMEDDTEAAFWQLAGFLDCHGPHKIQESGAAEKIIRRFHAWEAWNHKNYLPRMNEATEVTEHVERAISAIQKIIQGDPNMITEGEEWKLKSTEEIESFLVDEDENVRVFITDGAFCNSAYYSPKLQTVVKATVALDRKSGAISIAFEDGGKRYHASKVVQAIWDKNAGGKLGIAGSPRGVQMTREDLDKAVAYVRSLYDGKERCVCGADAENYYTAAGENETGGCVGYSSAIIVCRQCGTEETIYG